MFIKYNSIGQYSDVVRDVRSTSEYSSIPLPIIKFIGTVKLHGTNAGVIVNPNADELTVQSRERKLTVLDDNAGFAQFVNESAVKAELFDLASRIYKDHKGKSDNDYVQIYGEWCGPGIQKSVGINKITEKIFVIFGVRIGNTDEIKNFVNFHNYFIPNNSRIKSIYEFTTYEVVVDFNRPEIAQNKLIELTTLVANNCPVARKLLPDFPQDEVLLGEGIVWSSVGDFGSYTRKGVLMFKTKDPRHSASKIKTIAPIDVEMVENVRELVDYVVTDNRLNQAIEYLKEMNLELTPKSTGEFIKWVMKDIHKEEPETIAKSDINVKMFNAEATRKAREFFLNYIEI